MIYAKTLNPEHFDPRMYEWEIGGDVMIDGGDRLIGINDGEINNIKRMVENYGGYEYECCCGASIKEYAEGALSKKENGKAFSPRELHDIKEALEARDSFRTYSEYEENAIVVCLSIIKCRPYSAFSIVGSVQREWATLYAPAATDPDAIAEIEALYFGTGTEVMVDDGWGGEVSDPSGIEGWCFYTSKWDGDDLKDEIALRCGVSSDEVTLFMFDGYERKEVYRKC